LLFECVELLELYRVRKPRMAEGLTGVFALLRDQVVGDPIVRCAAPLCAWLP
jgi:hypothetical protein